MVLLSKHQDWQARGREEVLQVFGDKKPDFDGLNHLKIVRFQIQVLITTHSHLTTTRTATMATATATTARSSTNQEHNPCLEWHSLVMKIFKALAFSFSAFPF